MSRFKGTTPAYLIAAVLLAAAPLSAQPMPVDLAEAHFEAGSRALAAGDPQTALREFQIAQATRPSPVLHWYIASAYEQLGEPCVALTYYRHYLAELPGAENAAEVAARAAELEPICRSGPPPVAGSMMAPGQSAPPPSISPGVNSGINSGINSGVNSGINSGVNSGVTEVTHGSMTRSHTVFRASPSVTLGRPSRWKLWVGLGVTAVVVTVVVVAVVLVASLPDSGGSSGGSHHHIDWDLSAAPANPPPTGLTLFHF